MRKILLALVVSLLAVPVSAQEKVPAGSTPTLIWSHDGTNVTHFRVYTQPAASTGATNRTRLGGDIPLLLVAGGQEFTLPAPLPTSGRFNLYVSAVNIGPAGVTTPTLSPPFLIEMVVTPMPTPTAPSNLRFVIKVARNTTTGAWDVVFESVTVDADK